MAQTRWYYSSDAALTTLAAPLGSVSPGTTGTVQVNSITGNPGVQGNARFPFTLVVEPGTTNSEVITVTQAATGTGPFTYSNSIRGDDGSAAPAHSAGVTIAHGAAGRDLYKTDWVNVVQPAYGADPTGVVDSTTAINNALTDAYNNAPGQPVYLPAGIYKTTSPILIPPGAVLIGDHSNEVAKPSVGRWGSIIQPSATWAQGTAPANAIIVVQGQFTGGYANVADEQKLYDFAIDCSLLTTGSADGIQFYGGISRPRVEHVLIEFPRGAGVNFVNDLAGNGQDAVHMFRCNVLHGNSVGILHPKISDSTYIDCLVEGCAGDGWQITNASSGVFIGCRSEHNGTAGVGNGYTFTATSSSTGSGGCRFIGCSTDRNEGYGFYISSNNNSAAPVILSGCAFRRDGRNGNAGGGVLSGIFCTAFPNALQISGCQVWPGVDDDGSGVTSPQVGMILSSNNTNKTFVQVGGATYIQGFNSAIIDDGTTAATLYDLTVLAASGSTSAPTVQGPRYGTASLSSGVATVACTSVTSSSVILVTAGVTSGTPGFLHVGARNAGTSFVVSSSNGGDNSAFYWQINNP